MTDILAGIGGLVAGVAATVGVALAWRARPRLRKPELHTLDITHGNWVCPAACVDFSGAPPIEVGMDVVDAWLSCERAAPVSWHIRSVLLAGRAQSLVITGVRPHVRQLPGLVMHSTVVTQLGGNGYLRRRANVTIGPTGTSVRLFDDTNQELTSLGLNLSQGDALEFLFCLDAETPGAAHAISLELELLADGKPTALAVADGRCFTIGTAPPDAATHTYPGANLMY
ncbi:hypothetical protein [Streptomyces sp. NPDC127108]|uniref:hypothetical protein n=1 Tax=Streptomyces sp. NPDC127108 TaxID=3345361 RepID=UPI003632A5DF